jgi:V/A-type H+/Na+-transporting ATPase subunit I
MAILPLSKVTLYGAAGEKDSVLNALQELGCMHLVDLSGEVPPGHSSADVSVETHQALKFLQSCPIHRRPVKDEGEFRPHEVVQEVGRNERRQDELHEERGELTAVMEALRPWGDFHLPGDDEFGPLRLWFYTVPHYRLGALKSAEVTWQVVARDHRFAYVVVISPSEPEGMPAPRVDLDRRPLSELSARLEQIDAELEELHWQRIAATRWIDAVRRTIDLADEQAAREHAARLSLDDPYVFALQGWAPVRELDRVRSFAAARSLALVIEPPGADDSPPTLLENPPALRGGEDAVTFYMTPAYNAWDPSSIVFISFSVFFAMIMADAGYALVLGGLLLLLWRKLGRSPGAARMRRLALAIVVASTAYGVLIGSYFGRLAETETLLGGFHVIDASDTGLMMRISIILGVFHLVLANLIVGWQARWSSKMLSSLGWSVVLLGGLAIGLGKSEGRPGEEFVLYGTWLLVGGIASVLFFSSDRPIWTLAWRSHLWRLFDGFVALTNVSRAFGDVLSYLRLFALGLASAQLAVTFNELTYQVSRSTGVGALLAVLVFIFGHGLNLTLAVMSGVVHGLRLNCIEFFGWGLTDEGYPFRPFSRNAT